jgi:glycosyltransferase involved in cell wall biosynthesis
MMLRRARIEEHALKRLYFWQEGVRLWRYERAVCPQFDLNITCSSLDTERLTSLAPRTTIAEVPNGVDTEYFRSTGEPEQPSSLVFAGNLSWYPNAAAIRRQLCAHWRHETGISGYSASCPTCGPTSVGLRFTYVPSWTGAEPN